MNHNVCAFKKESILRFKYPISRMEDFLLWTMVLNSDLKIYNQDKELLIADVNDLDSRRIGYYYRKAELKLFLMNFNESNYFGKLYSFLALLIRYPLRFKYFKFFLNVIYKCIRS